MKTLIEMKKVYCFNRFVLFVMVLSLATTFTSCSNDDDEDIPVYSLKDVEGNYLGKMTTESAPVIPTENAGESEEPVGIEVNAEVKDNEIAINKFPVEDLIKSIIEDPDQAEIIIKAIGDINYKIPYTATFNENKDNILLQLQPEPLEIKFDPSTQLTANEKEPTEITVIVTVQADEKGDFAYNGKTLKFAIKRSKSMSYVYMTRSFLYITKHDRNTALTKHNFTTPTTTFTIPYYQIQSFTIIKRSFYYYLSLFLHRSNNRYLLTTKDVLHNYSLYI